MTLRDVMDDESAFLDQAVLSIRVAPVSSASRVQRMKVGATRTSLSRESCLWTNALQLVTKLPPRSGRCRALRCSPRSSSPDGWLSRKFIQPVPGGFLIVSQDYFPSRSSCINMHEEAP